ncbi:two-component sensor histidine kinase [Thioclava sp. SK-1]|uniref:sensor histidine kinase RegB n=1 Tax=Thioclava sp. SK-1 TaxID=1889770 RepID=UPI0008244536|nr:ActS/PrrB/RegB family redox-sensitive histidine kinase [Thioclava sp. SK-1]OCX61581.1 two-component sensor histidine kinase [Thioclava sp. SK-1]
MSGFPDAGMARIEAHHEWVRLRTLIFLRWTAITGQLIAIFVANFLLGFHLDLALCLATVGAAVAANLVAIFLFPENRRLSQTEATSMLLFDTAQLALLLALTGGLNNPFALLMLVPATIAATALERLPTMLVGSVAIALISIVALVFTPLQLVDGTMIEAHPLFEFGYWLAIVIGVAFLGAYAHKIASEIHTMGDALLATQLALAREQKLTDLGGVVAAAAHELGTPLATIKLVSSELYDELSDREDLREDALLIREQADRCRDIMRSMGRAGKDDKHLRSAPLMAVIKEAAEPHLDRGKTIHFHSAPMANGPERQPIIYRYPELIHALRNLVQNAVDFANTSVWVDAKWSQSEIVLRISDDGRGYAPDVIGRIGDPFLHARTSEQRERGPYEGMGLGLFIAKTLLERTGVHLKFRNGQPDCEQSGAVVELRWPAYRLVVRDTGALGTNQQIIK